MKISHRFLFAACLFMSMISIAQQDSSSKEKIFSVKLGLYYNSSLNYYGRTDSLRSSGFFPVAEVGIGNHFYINAAPVFTHNALDGFQYAGSVLTAGVRYNKNKEYNSNLYIVRPIYKDNSQLVQSALKAQLAGTYTWLTKLINVTAGADVKYSDKFDYGLTGGLDHIFRFELGQSILVIDPSAYINAGTQQFTSTSYKKSGFFLFPGYQQEITEKVNKFNILSYEFSMPVVFAKGKYQLIANPAYVLPQNLLVVPNRPDLSERGRNMFYATVGAKYNF